MLDSSVKPTDLHLASPDTDRFNALSCLNDECSDLTGYMEERMDSQGGTLGSNDLELPTEIFLSAPTKTKLHTVESILEVS